MIVDEQRRVCIITPPKCGTTSLHDALCPPAIRCDGPQFDGIISKHTHILPIYIKDSIQHWRILFLARNPFSRLLSLYGHWIQYWEGGQSGTLQQFVETIVIPQHSAFLCSPLSCWVRTFYNVNPDINWETFQFEKRDTILLKYGLNTDIPKLNVSEHGSYEEEYTPNLIRFVQHWARYDFELFGYSAEPWWDRGEKWRHII